MMAIKVNIPTSMQRITQGRAEVEAEGADVKELIDDLDKRYRGIKDKIYAEEGRVYRFINIYVNGEDIRGLDQERTLLKEKDEVDIIAAIPGG